MQIDGADIATTDDANGGFLVHKRVKSFFLRVSQGIQADALLLIYILWHNERFDLRMYVI